MSNHSRGTLGDGVDPQPAMPARSVPPAETEAAAQDLARADWPTALQTGWLAEPDVAFRTSLEKWEFEPGTRDAENRTEAATLIRLCGEEGLTSLDLSYLGLTSLPTALWMVDRPGTACHEAGGLQELRLNDNQLFQLPAGIGQLHRLRKLSLSGNQLSVLPASIGELTHLVSLRLADNDLSVLPDTLGRLVALESLSADGCLLTTLPASLSHLPCLRHLDLEDNLLTSLPQTIDALPENCLVRLFMNPLPSRVRTALRDNVGGPVFLVDELTEEEGSAAFDSADKAPNDCLSVAAFAWLIESTDRSAAALVRWQKLETVPYAKDFARQLHSLACVPEARNWNTQAVFRTRICQLLNAVVRHPTLAALSFRCAHDALVQRLTWQESLEKLEALLVDDDAQRRALHLDEILTLALRRFRLHELDAIVAEQMSHWRFADAPDVRLAYRTALAGRIDFSADGRLECHDHALLDIAAADIDAAQVRILAAERGAEALAFLVDYAPWRAGLCRHSPEMFEAMLLRFDAEWDVLSASNVVEAAASEHVEPDSASKSASKVTAKVAFEATSEGATLASAQRLMRLRQDAEFRAALMDETASRLLIHK